MTIDVRAARNGGATHAGPDLAPAARYRAVRGCTEALAAPLSAEDCVVQSMPDASPVKWHLAHTTWFFETFLLIPHLPGYRPFDERFGFLFNSYYNTIGDRIPRARRGLITRPTLDDVRRYRAHVDEKIEDLLAGPGAHALGAVLTLGLNHEQQHQELILTDVKFTLSCNPLRPAYRERDATPAAPPGPAAWVGFPEALRWIGHAGNGNGFAFDNEGPRHREFVPAFRLATRPVTNGEYLEFMADRGYDRPEFWLSDGWAARTANGWSAPLYWERRGDGWETFTLAGMRPLVESEPACHVSYYEADAFARWAGARLPTEAEWEVAAADRPISGHWLDDGRFHPAPESGATDLEQLFGDVWEWTASPYTPYPGFRPDAGALGEYNGKFMCNQFVLRGGSCATPRGHVRASYRNFFPPEARWQFSGIRLASDA